MLATEGAEQRTVGIGCELPFWQVQRQVVTCGNVRRRAVSPATCYDAALTWCNVLQRAGFHRTGPSTSPATTRHHPSPQYHAALGHTPRFGRTFSPIWDSVASPTRCPATWSSTHYCHVARYHVTARGHVACHRVTHHHVMPPRCLLPSSADLAVPCARRRVVARRQWRKKSRATTASCAWRADVTVTDCMGGLYARL